MLQVISLDSESWTLIQHLTGKRLGQIYQGPWVPASVSPQGSELEVYSRRGFEGKKLTQVHYLCIFIFLCPTDTPLGPRNISSVCPGCTMMWLKPMYRPGQQKRRQTVRQEPKRSSKDVDILSQGRHEPPPQAGAHQRTQENQNLWSHASKHLRPVCRGLKFSQPGSWPLRNRSASCGIQTLMKLGILSPESSAFHFAHGDWTRGFLHAGYTLLLNYIPDPGL